ncbi:helix-turn-helix transcriptional regulator [Streptomyces sp. NBC_00237]|uniref:helix-turn-helix transcriptional regulator n=1 Tax=Streptomyces sp. NBC_00237 TaxID=2975687 RepID=UPI00224E2356|nr:helix-turn-helix transcriptional regulator [Streptomyces sp. NBC_00237]MCX5200280.1 helix-turn-helix transcriptional regulator [Streptomyces sp. NBC_00237]
MSRPSLEFLGITPDDESTYRHLLRAADDAPSEAGHRLVELGLATTTPDGDLRPVPPAKVVERLVERRIARTQDELEDEVSRSGIVDSLLAERAPAPTGLAPSGPGGGSSVQRLESIDDIRAAIDELTFFTRTENLTTQPGGVLRPQNIANSRTNDMRVLRRGVSMRTLMGSAALTDPPTLAYLRELVGKGAEVRISHHPLERMIICDRAAALTPLDPADPGKGALLIRETGLVSALVSLYERMWEQAQELPAPTGEDAPEAHRPTGVELKVLESLYSADKDETGARDLGISVRTYRKHVASLMHRLEATNRFQIALLSRERGWL